MNTCLTYRAQTRKARKSAISSVHTEMGEQKKRQAHMQHRGTEMKVLGQGGNGRALHKMEAWSHLG